MSHPPVSIGRVVHVFIGGRQDEGPFAFTVAGINSGDYGRAPASIDGFIYRPLWETPRVMHRIPFKDDAKGAYPHWTWPTILKTV